MQSGVNVPPEQVQSDPLSSDSGQPELQLDARKADSEEARSAGGDLPRPVSRAAAVYWFGEIGTRGVQFLMLPFMGSVMSPATYGLFAAVGSLLAGGSALLPFGLDAGASRFIPPADSTERQRLSGTALLGSLVLAAVPAASAALLVPAISGFEALSPSGLRAAFGLALLLSAAGMTSLAVMRSLLQAKRFVLAVLSRVLVLAAVFAGLWVSMDTGYSIALWPLLVSWIVFGMSAIAIQKPFPKLRLHRRELAILLMYGAPLLPHVAAHWVLGTTDRILLQTLGAGDDVGAYAFTYQLCTLSYIVALSLNNAWAPLFMASHSTRRSATMSRSYSSKMIAVVTLVSLTLVGIIPALVRVMSLPSYWVGSELAGVLCAGFVMLAVYLAAANPLLLTGRTGLISSITVPCAVANIVANLILIPRWGMWAPAWVTLGTYAVLGLATTAALGRRARDYIDLPAVAATVLVCFACIAVLQPLAWNWRLLVTAVVLAILVPIGRRSGLLADLGLRSLIPSLLSRRGMSATSKDKA